VTSHPPRLPAPSEEALPEHERERIRALHASLGIGPELIAARALPPMPLAARLEACGQDVQGRPVRLLPEAAAAWRTLLAAARSDGLDLVVVSSFRDLDHQAALVRRRLERGERLEDALRVVAPPGYSEHHTGRALDLAESARPALEEAFASCPSGLWLRAHAARFGFRLSYPRGNPWGFIHEPWHWAWVPDR
jgi:D-alanyl-D-alanine carboxypeptidase